MLGQVSKKIQIRNGQMEELKEAQQESLRQLNQP